jgi:hypothetical protein
MHPLWQAKQVVSVDGVMRVDRCNNFGGRASLKVWMSVISLVLWIAAFEYFIEQLKCFVDDHFSFAIEGDLTWYEPYHKFMPTPQAKLLCLWDELGLPHEERKQVSGPILTIIGFEIDANEMTMTMADDKKAALVDACRPFTHARAKKTLRDFWGLQGHINWSLNVFPLLRPCLSALYAKTAGKTKPRAMLRVNTSIIRELIWFTDHVSRAPGVHFLKSVQWSTSDNIDTLTAYVDASGFGLRVWFPLEKLGFQCAVRLQMQIWTYL